MNLYIVNACLRCLLVTLSAGVHQILALFMPSLQSHAMNHSQELTLSKKRWNMNPKVLCQFWDPSCGIFHQAFPWWHIQGCCWLGHHFTPTYGRMLQALVKRKQGKQNVAAVQTVCQSAMFSKVLLTDVACFDY